MLQSARAGEFVVRCPRISCRAAADYLSHDDQCRFVTGADIAMKTITCIGAAGQLSQLCPLEEL